MNTQPSTIDIQHHRTGGWNHHTILRIACNNIPNHHPELDPTKAFNSNHADVYCQRCHPPR